MTKKILNFLIKKLFLIFLLLMVGLVIWYGIFVYSNLQQKKLDNSVIANKQKTVNLDLFNQIIKLAGEKNQVQLEDINGLKNPF